MPKSPHLRWLITAPSRSSGVASSIRAASIRRGMKPVSGGIARSGCASSIRRSRVVPERGAPTTKGTGTWWVPWPSAPGSVPRNEARRAASRDTGAQCREGPAAPGAAWGALLTYMTHNPPMRRWTGPLLARRQVPVHVAAAGVCHGYLGRARGGRRYRPQPYLAPDADEALDAEPASRPERSLRLVGEVHALEGRRELHVKAGGRDGQRHLAVVLERELPAPRIESQRVGGGSRSVEGRAAAPALDAPDDGRGQ